MMQVYGFQAGCLVTLDPAAGTETLERAVWFDLIDPTAEEERLVEGLLHIDVPTREEMGEIEVSSRLYLENGALHTTASVLFNADTPEPELTVVTFILKETRLVTVRFVTPKVWTAFCARAARPGGIPAPRGDQLFAELVEAIVDRLADVLERVGQNVDGLSRRVFRTAGAERLRGEALQHLLGELGKEGDLLSKARESLASLDRMLLFAEAMIAKDAKEVRVAVRTARRDVDSLRDHAGFINNKTSFLLDAMLGLINIEQNQIIKLFSVIAVVLLPPTLVASIYGMNFEIMPELGWRLGYPFALGLMVLAAVLPYWLFKRRGWL